MQLGNKFNFKRITDKKKFALNLFFKTLSIFAVVAVIYLLLSVIKGVIFLPVNRTTFLFLLFIVPHGNREDPDAAEADPHASCAGW